MRKSQRTRWMVGVAAVVASFAMVALSPLTSLAATTKSNASSQTSDNGLQISPTRTDMSVNPGGTASFQLAIKNVTSIALIAKATLNDFESNNINGQPQLLTKPGEHSPRSLKPYLQGLTNLTLQSGQTKTVQLYVAVPKDTAPGGYYGAVRFTAQPVTPAKNVGSKRISLTASVASLVLMEVNGPVSESLNFDSMNAVRGGSPGTIFFGKGPDQVQVKLTNKGNGFSQPIGSVNIKKGGKVLYTYQFNTDNAGLHSTILPNSSRTFKDSIKNVSSFGHYVIQASIAYKQGGEAVTLTQSFWVIPNFVIYIIVGVLVLIAAGVVLWKLARRTR